MSKIRSFLIIIGILILTPFDGEAKTKVRTISGHEADSLARIQVIYRDRVVPFQTVARDLTFKLTGKTKVSSMNDVQFVTSLMLYPSDWVNVPLFKIKNKALADSLGICKDGLAPISLLFDENQDYKLKDWYKGSEKGLDKEILELDEKVEMILMLRTNSLFLPLSQENVTKKENLHQLTSSMISLEIFYNRIGIVRWLFIPVFCLFILFILVVFFIQVNYLHIFLAVCLCMLTMVSIFNFVARWIIGGHIPLAGGEQVMMFMTMLLLIGASFFSFIGVSKNNSEEAGFLVLGCLMMAGFTSLEARISSTDPIVTNISTALASPWLAFHVSVIMASYAVLVIILPLSMTAELANIKKVRKLLPLIYRLNIIGVILLGLGIVLGSLWAKGAWGSYWSWDPKENWAALTFIAYLLPVCFSRYFLNHPHKYNAILICAFLFMIITYFGVNYMVSLHSYGA